MAGLGLRLGKELGLGVDDGFETDFFIIYTPYVELHVVVTSFGVQPFHHKI